MEQDTNARDQEEIEIFLATIRAFRYDEDEFVLRHVQWSQTAKPASATCDLVIVKRISTGAERAYYAGDNAAWLVSFFDDLNLGVFGEYVHPGWQRSHAEMKMNYKQE
jgi:hypothetical protein